MAPKAKLRLLPGRVFGLIPLALHVPCSLILSVAVERSFTSRDILAAG
jgi:hypothetical protein